MNHAFHSLVSSRDEERAHHDLHSRPHLSRSAGTPFVRGFGFEDIDRMLSVQGIGHPHMFLLNSKRGIRKFSFYPHSDGFTRLYRPGAVLSEMIREGTSLLLHNLHEHHPAIAAFHRYVAGAFPSLDKTVCFLTPPEAQATTPHTDDHPNIVVQLAGTKVWQVWGLVEEHTLREARSVAEAEELLRQRAHGEPVIDAELEPGDALLVPERFLHTARTNKQFSLSIVFQLRCCTPDSVYRRFLQDNSMIAPSRKRYVPVV